MNALVDSIGKAKRTLQRIIYPLGSTATVLRGPLRGCRYVVTAQSGWAPILGRWEPDAQRLYVCIVGSGEVVWDLGANTGIHTLLFSRLAGDSGAVVAFEPLQVNVREIERTCALNSARNVSVVDKAVSDRSGFAIFHTGRHDKQGSLVGIGSENGHRIEVDCITLDQALHTRRAPDFLKIDIEGAESQALAGFNPEPCRYPSFAIDLHTPAEDVAVGRWMERHGYRMFRLVDDVARRQGISGAVLSDIRNPRAGWPNKDGVWGTIVAVHAARPEKLAAVEALTATAP